MSCALDHGLAVVADGDGAGADHLAELGERLAASGRPRSRRWDRRAPRRARCAWRRMNPTAAWLSVTGSVFGIAQTAVNPPAAAARAPVAIVSTSSRPGSRRWQCTSMKPGRHDESRAVDRLELRRRRGASRRRAAERLDRCRRRCSTSPTSRRAAATDRGRGRRAAAASAALASAHRPPPPFAASASSGRPPASR